MTPGDQYRVVKDGGRLNWWEPRGPNCQQGASLALKIGDVITYERTAHGGGSDDVDYDNFSKDGKCGAFWPNNWGCVDSSFLELVALTPR
jgi:hypothetical protein